MMKGHFQSHYFLFEIACVKPSLAISFYRKHFISCLLEVQGTKSELVLNKRMSSTWSIIISTLTQVKQGIKRHVSLLFLVFMLN